MARWARLGAEAPNFRSCLGHVLKHVTGVSLQGFRRLSSHYRASTQTRRAGVAAGRDMVGGQMKRMVEMALPATGLVALGALGASALGVGAAGAAETGPAAIARPATFQMYANVDAEYDLGSNYGAVRVKQVPGPVPYIVTFKKPVGHCAAVVQVGKAGGPDADSFVSTTMDPYGANSFVVAFGTTDSAGQTSSATSPS